TTALKDGDRRARNRLRALLVVAEVALSLMLLVGASIFVRSILNIYNADAGKEPRVTFFGTTPHVLDTLGQTMIAGRGFTDAEASTRSRTAIVNQALASRAWPGGSDTVGRRFRFAGDPPDEWFTVIGVISDFQPLIFRDKGIVEPLAMLPFPYQALRDTG